MSQKHLDDSVSIPACWAGLSRSKLLGNALLLAASAAMTAGSLFGVSLHEVFTFYSGPGGACPNGKVLLVAATNQHPPLIYGTTYYGGTNNNGIVYQLTQQPNGSYTETVIYNFTGGSDGGNPTANVIMDAMGNLYTTASTGGVGNNGTVIELVPGANNTFTPQVILQFNGTNGSDPNSDLVLGPKGALAGTTVYGGTSNQGTVFLLTPPATPGGTWTPRVLHSFTDGADGGQPYGGLTSDLSDPQHTLYGTTYVGGTNNAGTVFKLVPTLTPVFTTIYTLKGGTTDGLNPLAGVTLDPLTKTLLGTTYLGGKFGDGIVFQLTPPASGTTYTETVLVNFDGQGRGANPSDKLITDGQGKFYGTTGGAQAGIGGSAFAMTLKAFSTLYSFSGTTDGQAPLPSVSESSQGAIYGTTFYGGLGGAGSVFVLK